MSRGNEVGFRIALAAALWLAPAAGLAQEAQAPPEPDYLEIAAPAGRTGGRLVVALRDEPQTLNPTAATNNPSLTVIHRLNADLVHIDRETQRTVGALAKRWTAAPDGKSYTVELRRGIRFSDGEPFDADDVVFTFEVFLDQKVGAPNRDLLVVGGEPLAVTRLGSHRVRFDLTQPYPVGDRIFDSIPILPRHRLEAAYREGRLADAWALTADPEKVVGLGPFRFKRYVPGERLELERNPHYWKVDAAGRRLPYLDRLTFLFVASEDAQVVRFQAGETHLIDRLSARNYALLERERTRRGYMLRDLGPGLTFNFLFFNQNDLGGKDLDEIAAKQAWFRDLAFRRAVSAAVDRAGIVRLVFGGRATPLASHVTPGDRLWLHRGLEPPAHSPQTARELLRAAGYVWDDAGRLRDAGGRRVEFTVVTNSSNRERMAIATILQEDLGELGIAVRVAGLEFRALIDRIFGSHDYEAVVLALGGGDVDPNSAINVLTSGGSHRLWRLAGGGVRPSGEEPWQQEIDRLMKEQLTTLDPAARKKLYDRVQELVAENVPAVFLVSPNVLVGAAAGLGNFRPAVLLHNTLWNVDELHWRSPPGG